MIQHSLNKTWSYALKHEEFVSSPAFPAIYGISYSYLYCFFWVLIDICGILKSYKLQPNKNYTWNELRETIQYQLFSQLIFVMPPTIIGYLLDIGGINGPLPLEAPLIQDILVHLFFGAILFDIGFGSFHQLLHTKYLFDHVHSVHHKYHSPFSFVTNYVHPIELIGVSLITILIPKLLFYHPLTEWIWTIVSITISVDAHVGYDIPWSIHRLFPGIMAGPAQHDAHHIFFKKNYAVFFTFYDRLNNSYMSTSEVNAILEKRRQNATRTKIK